MPTRLVVYDADQWGSACPVLRVAGPAQVAGLDVVRGNTWSEGVLRGYSTEAVSSAQVVVVQRDFPRYEQAYAAVVAEARANRKTLLYELDDLLLEVPPDHPSYGYYSEARAAILAAVAEADAVTTSTPALADYLMAVNPRVRVLRNYLDDRLWRLRPPRPPAADGPVVIGYMGGHTHAADLAQIGPVLSRLVQKYGDHVRLRFWGVAPPAEVADLPIVEWTKLAILDYEQYAAYLQQQMLDICLAPLRNNLFNRCKSPIKYLEYGALGVAGVYSRLEPYNLIVRDGINGLLAGDEAEWEAALVELIEHPDRRSQLAEQAQATIQAGWLLAQHANEWQEVYQAIQLEGPGTQAASPQAHVARKALAWQRALVAQTQAQESMIQVQQSQLLRLQAERDQYSEQAAKLVEITSSPSWSLLQYLTATRYRFIPKGSRGERALDMLVLAIRYWQQAGTLASVARMVEAFEVLLPRLARGMTARLAGRGDPYQTWIKAHEPSADGLNQQRRNPDQAAWPRISLLTPVYNPPAAALAETLASVRAQTYSNWELCLVDGNSDAPGVHALLETAARDDERVKIKWLDKNLGIARNQNEGLALATGEYVLVLDHDDLLAPDALFNVARLLGQEPDLDVVYFDEDKISEDGRLRRDPWFKPSAWSPDLTLSTNVLMHGVVRRRLLQELGGYNPLMDGAQDWDMALRLGQQTRRIAHIPRVFYHWRQVPGSAARDANAKPWALTAQKGVIEAHLQRLGTPAASVSFPSIGRVHVHWPTSGARVSIIVPTRDHLDLLRPCLDSILRCSAYANYEIILVDTGSLQPDTWRYYADLKSRGAPLNVVRFAGEFNYSAANNLGASQATGDLLLFLNNDVEVLASDWLVELVGWAERPEVGVVGCKLLRPDGTIQHGGLVMGLAGHGSHVFDGSREDTYGPFGSSEWYRDFQAVTGACLMIRRTVFEGLQGFDEAYQIGYGDIELCLRAGQQGYRVVYTPFARLLHHEGGSRGFYNPPADVLRAYLQMLPLVKAGDPYFSPNLSYEQRQPRVATPGELPRAARLEQILNDFDLVAGTARFTKRAPHSTQAALRVTGGDSASARRVLLVTHEQSQSGAPMALAKLAQQLTRAGYCPAVLSPVEGPLRAMFEQAGIEVQVDPGVLTDARVAADRLPGFGLLLANTILSWRAVYAARALQVPCLWWIHESTFGQTLAQRSPAVARAFEAADKVMFPSRANAQLYAPYLKAEKTVVMPTGLEWPPAETEGPAIARPAGKLVLVTIASLEPRKGQDVLLASIAALTPELRSQIELFLMGQILDRRYYRRLAQAARQYPGVHLLGAVPHSQAIAYLAAADLFVLPSRDEVLPIALLEAMALGKGIVASAVGGIPEAVEHGTQAWLVPPDNASALSHGLARLLGDQGLRERLGEAARARFQMSFTSSKFAEAVEDEIRRLVEARQIRQLNASLGQREALGQSFARYESPYTLERSANL